MPASTRAIRIAYPEAPDLHLAIRAGACHLRIRPGGNAAWLSGRYHDPTGEHPCRLHRRGGMLRVRQPEAIDLAELVTGIPTIALQLGRTKPCALTIEEAAGDCTLDLGGLPVRELTIEDQAGTVTLDFSAPNPQLMCLLDLDTGAASVRARNLANANFGELCLGGHAASYSLDFGGDLRHSARANISISSRSSLEITVPSSTAAHVTTGVASERVDAGAGWTRAADGFRTPAAITGRGPILTVDTGLGLGSLQLRIS